MISFGLVVDELVVGAHAVGNRLEPFAGLVGGRAVRQMSALGERHAHVGVARLQQREENGLVRLRARVGLHVGVVAAEQFFGARDGERFGLVDEGAAAVIAAAGIAFGVFVGQHRALRFEHRAAHDIFGRDQLDFVLLAPQFAVDRRANVGIGIGQARAEKALGKIGIERAGGFGRRHRRCFLR
jgi:hypothetical protein